MDHPWEKIDFKIYETHMASENIRQLQTLNIITKQQLNDYVQTNVAILGIAGGNGLEYIDINQTKRVYGLDINREYLDICKRKYLKLKNTLELIHCDLTDSNTLLPYSNILICNLIIEYLGISKFIEIINNNRENINIVSCVIQKNYNDDYFVSDSSLTSAFDPLNSIHNDIAQQELLQNFLTNGFSCIKKVVYPLPNGKEFIRLDFKDEK